MQMIWSERESAAVQQQKERPPITLPYLLDLCQPSPRKPYLCRPSVRLKGHGAGSCVSLDVNLEALNSQFWQTTALEFTSLLSRWKVRQKGVNQRKMTVQWRNECSQLPGIQCHSSPCKSLGVWGRRALSGHSSPPLCLQEKDITWTITKSLIIVRSKGKVLDGQFHWTGRKFTAAWRKIQKTPVILCQVWSTGKVAR